MRNQKSAKIPNRFLKSILQNQKTNFPLSEIRYLKTKIRNPFEIRNPKSEIRNGKSETQKSETQKSEIRNPEIGNQKSEIRNQKSEIRTQKPRNPETQKSEIRTGELNTRAKRLRMRKVSIFKMAVANANFTTRTPFLS